MKLQRRRSGRLTELLAVIKQGAAIFRRGVEEEGSGCRPMGSEATFVGEEEEKKRRPSDEEDEDVRSDAEEEGKEPEMSRLTRSGGGLEEEVEEEED